MRAFCVITILIVRILLRTYRPPGIGRSLRATVAGADVVLGGGRDRGQRFGLSSLAANNTASVLSGRRACNESAGRVLALAGLLLANC